MDCFYHSGKPAVGSCTNCGHPICVDCLNKHAGKNYCDTCAKRMQLDTGDIANLTGLFRKVFGERCPECGKPISSEYKICPFCETKLVLSCSSCGRQLNPNWKVCPYCATVVESLSSGPE